MSPADAVYRPSAAPSVLVLGGTTEAREIADALAADGWAVTTSLAGRTSDPALPAGQVRVGGFGGDEGLRDWLQTHGPACVVDATHPYALGISTNAARATAQLGVPLLRLRRPGWAQTHPAAPTWAWADSHGDAARRAHELRPPGSTVLLTVGRQSTAAYVPALAADPVVARVAEARDLRLPATWRLVQARGPFDAATERALFAEAGVGVLVSKDSGGASTAAKLDVATEFGVAVVIVRRPQPPQSADAEVLEVSAVDAALRWCRMVTLGGRAAEGTIRGRRP